MLDQLVESKNTSGENTRRGGFILTTLVVVVSVFLGGLLYSLFAKDYGMGGGDLELSTLVAPVPVPEDEPPPEPEPEEKPVKQEKAAPNVDTRTEIIQRMDQTPVKPPETTSVVQNTVKPPREGLAVRLGTTNNDAENAAPDTYKGRGNTEGTGIAGGTGEARTGSAGGGDDEPPPAPKPKPPPPTPTPTPAAPKKVSLGVINGKASNLVTPPYPATARAVRASGAVNVSVQIDERGNVTSANAVSGHPLLRQAAEQAARQSKFTPTVLSGQPVAVSGIIVYNFVAQ